MQGEVKLWLENIEKAISEIEGFLADCSSFSDFQRSIKTKRATERNLEIIGEAMSRILKKYPDVEISNSRKIVDTRNRIIHGYDSVSDEIIWLIATRYLPVLAKEVEAIKRQY